MNKINTVLKNFHLSIKEWKKTLRYDIIAGITVALVMIPQSMAYAGLANLPMEMGLYTALMGMTLAALFGSSKQMISGPVTIVSIMTGASIGSLGVTSSTEMMIYASILAMMVGVFYLILSLLKMGSIIDFLSHPVILGFTNAIALITIISQLSKIFGISPEKGSHYIETIYLLIKEIFRSTHFITLAFGVPGIIFLLAMKIYFPKIPRVLILIIITTIISYFIGFETHYGGKVVGTIPAGLPSFVDIKSASSIVSIDMILKLLPFALMIGIIGFTESVSVAKIVSVKTKQKISSNQELIGQGLANIGSGAFGGYPVAGSFSRTAVNLKNDAKTRFAAIIGGLVIAITLIFFTPLLYHIPLAILSAIIIVAVGGLIRFTPIFSAYKIQKQDGFIGILTFILTIVFTPNVEIAIAIGVIISIVFYIRKSMRPKIVELGYYKSGVLRDSNFFHLQKSEDISIFRIDGNLFFGNCGYFERTILNMISEKKHLKIVVFDFEWMSNIDSSAFEMLKDFIEKLKSEHIKVYMCGLRTKVIYKMYKIGYIKKFGKQNIFEKTDKLLEALKEKYEKNEVDLTPLIEYKPVNKKSTKEAEQIMKKIHA